MNVTGNKTYPNFWFLLKAVLIEKMIVLNYCIRKQRNEKYQCPSYSIEVTKYIYTCI